FSQSMCNDDLLISSCKCANITVAKLKEVLIKKYNVLISSEIMVAINEEYANENDIIQTGDVVAMIPPVSGG
ncbi:MoaD/ThiS family protein, partial [Bacillus sp. D-CC]